MNKGQANTGNGKSRTIVRDHKPVIVGPKVEALRKERTAKIKDERRRKNRAARRARRANRGRCA